MHDFTNPSKRLRAQFPLFVERFVYPFLGKPDRKLAFDMAWGIISSGSVVLTEICRRSSPGQRLKTEECRVSEALSDEAVQPASVRAAAKVEPLQLVVGEVVVLPLEVGRTVENLPFGD